jgi:hypothetical protein
MEVEDRRRTVANAMRSLLEEGESFNVYCHEGEVWVDEVGTSVCAARSPRLYGRLLALNAELEQAGSGIWRFPILVAVVFCVGLRLEWWDDWMGPFATRLNSIWFYLLVAFVLYQVLSFIAGFLERLVYQRGREEVLSLLAAESLDRDSLLTMLEGDPAVSRVSYQIKLDADAGRSTA